MSLLPWVSRPGNVHLQCSQGFGVLDLNTKPRWLSLFLFWEWLEMPTQIETNLSTLVWCSSPKVHNESVMIMVFPFGGTPLEHHVTLSSCNISLRNCKGQRIIVIFPREVKLRGVTPHVYSKTTWMGMWWCTYFYVGTLKSTMIQLFLALYFGAELKNSCQSNLKSLICINNWDLPTLLYTIARRPEDQDRHNAWKLHVKSC